MAELSLVLGDFLDLGIILIIAAFAIPISRKASMIDLPFLILFGFIIGPVTGIISHSFSLYLMSEFGSVGIGLLGIVIILYYESHGINFRIIRRELMRIASLDTIGMVITAIVSGVVFSLITGAPLVIGFLFGAIISPTDPASLIPMFKKMDVQEEISGIIVGESLFNDPLGIILVAIGISLVDPSSTYIPMYAAISHFSGVFAAVPIFILIQIAVPTSAGVIAGFSVIYLNKIFSFDNLLVGFLIGVVLLEFTVLEAVNITPFPAAIATGAIIGNFSDKSIFWEREANFQQSLSYLSRALIFILLGSILTLSDISTFWVVGILVTLAVLFFSRPLAVFASILAAKFSRSRFRINNRMTVFMGLTGTKGAVSVVMSLVPYTLGIQENIPLLIQWGEKIYVATAFVVILSIIMQTIYVPIVSKKLLGLPLIDPSNGDKK
jgi:cell volume regulation protein A